MRFPIFCFTGQLRLPDDIANSLGTFKKKINEQVMEFNEKHAFQLTDAQQLVQPTGPRPSSSRNESSQASPAASPARTACRPLFEDGDCPRNLQKVLGPSVVLSSDAFSMEKTWLGRGGGYQIHTIMTLIVLAIFKLEFELTCSHSQACGPESHHCECQHFDCRHRPG